MTVTDANLVLGRLDADHFLGGSMRLDESAARAALTELAEHMGVNSPEEAAWGAIQVANANMERAIRKISVERGYDPRLFALLPFGGAGPLHACDLAQSLQIPQVVIPAVPGVLSALGMLVASPAKDFSRTVMVETGDWGTRIGGALNQLTTRAQAEMAAEGFATNSLVLHYSLDMRYKGQSHELSVPLTLVDEPAAVVARFHAAHDTRYGYARQGAVVEVVTVRVTAVSPITPPIIPAKPMQGPDAVAALLGQKPVWFQRQPMLTSLFDRDKLRPGNRFTGPAVVFQYDTTTVIPPGWQVEVDAYGNLLASYR